MVNKRQFRGPDIEGPSRVLAQLGGVGHTALLAALGVAARTARSAPPLISNLAASGERLLRLPTLPSLPDGGVEALFQHSLDRVLSRLSIPTREELEQLNGQLQALQQRLEAQSRGEPPHSES